MNSFNKNKEIVSICKNYYKIVNSDFVSHDKFSCNVIKIYRDYLFNIEVITMREKEKLVLIDNIMYKFITDKRFNKEMISKLSSLKVGKSVTNVVEYAINKLIEYFDEYKDTYTRSIYIPRWI